MPDVLTAVPTELKQPTQTEAFHHGGQDKTTVPTGAPKEQADRAEHLNAVREHANSTTGAEVFRANQPRPDFNKTDSNALQAQLGAEEAVLGTDGKPSMPTEASQDAKDIFAAGEEARESYEPVLQYTQIVAEAARTGRTAEQVYDKGAAEWKVFEDKALDTLLTDGGLREGIDGLKDLDSDPAAQRAIVKDRLATDPKLNEAMTTKLNDILRRSRELAKVGQGEELKKHEVDKVSAEKNIETNFELVFQTLGIEGGAQAELKAAIEPLIKAGVSQGEIQGRILLKLLKDKGITGINEYDAYGAAKLVEEKSAQTIKALQGEIDRLEGGRTRSDKTSRRAGELQDKVIDLQTQKAEAQATREYLKGSLGGDETKISAALRTISAMREQIYGTVGSDGMTREGGIGGAAKRLVEEDKRLSTANEAIEKTKASPEAAGDRAARLQAERGIVAEMRDLVRSSVAEVITGRQRDMIKLNEIRLQKLTDEAGEKGDEWTKNAAKAIKDDLDKLMPMDKNRRKRLYDRTHIKKRFDPFVHKGKDGGRESMGAIVNWSTDAAKQRSIVVEELYSGSDYDTLSLTDREKVDVAVKVRNEKFNEIYTREGANYEDTVMKAFLGARGLRDRVIAFGKAGELAYSNDEMSMFYENWHQKLEPARGREPADEVAKGAIPVDIATRSKVRWGIWGFLGGLGFAGAVVTGTGRRLVGGTP